MKRFLEENDQITMVGEMQEGAMDDALAGENDEEEAERMIAGVAAELKIDKLLKGGIAAPPTGALAVPQQPAPAVRQAPGPVAAGKPGLPPPGDGGAGGGGVGGGGGGGLQDRLNALKGGGPGPAAG